MIRKTTLALFTLLGLLGGAVACGSSNGNGTGGAATTGSTGSATGAGGSGGAGTSFTIAEFDPIDHVDEAFTNAAKVPSSTGLALLQLQATPVGTASDYADLHFTWAYAFAATVHGKASVITTDYPGWKTSTDVHLGIGAALPEKQVPTTIKIDATKLLTALATAKVSESTCPLKGKDALLLRGNLEPTGTIWLWDLFCGTPNDVDIDAGTGKKLSP